MAGWNIKAIDTSKNVNPKLKEGFHQGEHPMKALRDTGIEIGSSPLFIARQRLDFHPLADYHAVKSLHYVRCTWVLSPEKPRLRHMAKQKRKLTSAQKAAKKKRQREFMIVYINGKQKRVKRSLTIEGMDVDEYIRRNADPIRLHQNEM